MSAFDDFDKSMSAPSKERTFIGCYSNVFLEGRYFDQTAIDTQKAIVKYSKPHQAAIKTKSLSMELNREIMWKAFVEVSFVGWKNVKQAACAPADQSIDDSMKSTDATFSKESAAIFLKRYPRVAQMFIDDCSDITNFQETAPLDGDDAKN